MNVFGNMVLLTQNKTSFCRIYIKESFRLVLQNYIFQRLLENVALSYKIHD